MGIFNSMGRAILRYAERWAKPMQHEMENGKELETIANETSHVADDDDITGPMYGCAVKNGAVNPVSIVVGNLSIGESITINRPMYRCSVKDGVVNPVSIVVGEPTRETVKQGTKPAPTLDPK